LLYRQINNKFDKEILQCDFHNLELWAKKWLITFNISKCEVLSISLRNITKHSYILYEQPLRNFNKAKYLGVIIDSKLNFNKQIDALCKKANSALDFLKRNLFPCEHKIKSDVYLIYVCSILEYAACSWAPHTKQNIDKLESVQRRAAKFVMGD